MKSSEILQDSLILSCVQMKQRKRDVRYMANIAAIGMPQTADLNTAESSAASLVLKHKSGRKLRLLQIDPSVAARENR